MVRPIAKLTKVSTILILPIAAVLILAQTPAPRWSQVNQTLPEMNGKQLRVVQVEVRYGPGQASASHSHPCPVVVRVIEGSVRSKVDDNPETTYKEGETFYEPPNGTHAVSRNASETAPARILATFVCDSEGPISKPSNR